MTNAGLLTLLAIGYVVAKQTQAAAPAPATAARQSIWAGGSVDDQQHTGQYPDVRIGWDGRPYILRDESTF